MIERRKNGRREDDRPVVMYASPTVLFSWAGIAASGYAILMYPSACTEDLVAIVAILTLTTSFGAFVSRLFETRTIG